VSKIAQTEYPDSPTSHPKTLRAYRAKPSPTPLPNRLALTPLTAAVFLGRNIIARLDARLLRKISARKIISTPAGV